MCRCRRRPRLCRDRSRESAERDRCPIVRGWTGSLIRVPKPSRSCSAISAPSASPTMCDKSALGAAGPWTFTVAPDHKADYTWNVAGTGSGSAYDFSVYGPNGWYRLYQRLGGSTCRGSLIETDEDTYDDALRSDDLRNRGAGEVKVSILDEYTGAESSESLRVGSSITKQFELAESHNWYDLLSCAWPAILSSGAWPATSKTAATVSATPPWEIPAFGSWLWSRPTRSVASACCPGHLLSRGGAR